MKKTKVLWYLLDSIFLIVFNAFFFLLKGSDQLPSQVWICYVFIHFAYFVLLITPRFIRKGSASADYERPIFAITTSYFVLVFIISVVLIIFSTKSKIAALIAQLITSENKVADLLINFLTSQIDTTDSLIKYLSPPSNTVVLLIQITIAGFFAVPLLINIIANEHTAESIAKHEAELIYVKEASSKLKSLLNQLSDRKLQRLVERTYDLIHSSQVKSSARVQSIEQDVFTEISTLERLIQNKDFENVEIAVNKICSWAEERNRQLKLLN